MPRTISIQPANGHVLDTGDAKMTRTTPAFRSSGTNCWGSRGLYKLPRECEKRDNRSMHRSHRGETQEESGRAHQRNLPLS